MKRALADRLVARTGLGPVLATLSRWSGVLVFNYHRVGDPGDSRFDRGVWSADPESFTAQLRLCKRHLDMIGPDDLPCALADKRGRYGLITFDDGYRDNYDVAFPILKAEGVAATFFVATGFVDAPRVAWWDELAWMVRTSPAHALELPAWLPARVEYETDRERAVEVLLQAYKTMPSESTDRFLDAVAKATGSGRCAAELGKALWMTWDQLREMRTAGMTIGGHTVNHPVLSQASAERRRREILECGRRFAEEIGEPMRYFSYPIGDQRAIDTVTRRSLREAGVRYAFSYYGGFRRCADWDDYDIRRIGVEPHMTIDWLRSIVSLPVVFA
jgi:peptidoglycan/xylan/chitin deacetylase (PgdA/CDA1 family)